MGITSKTKTTVHKLLEVCEESGLTLEEMLEIPILFRLAVTKRISDIQSVAKFTVPEDPDLDDQE